MDFLTSCEGPLRSYIESHIGLLENALGEEVRNGDNVDIALLEQEFDRESDKLIAGVTKRIHQIRNEIKAHRPTNIQSGDYELRMIQYRQFLQSSSISINRMNEWVQLVFEEVTGIVKSIVQWMAENAQTIIDILEQIRDAFTFLATFFHHH